MAAARKALNQTAEVDGTPAPIESLDDWFLACGDIARDTEKYQNLVMAYHKARLGSSGPDAMMAYAARHDTSFWKNDKPVTGHIIKLCGITGGICAAVGLILGIVLSVFAGALSITGAIPFAIVGLVLGLLGMFGAKFFRARSLSKKMAVYEPELRRVLRYVPPKYRNAFCLRQFCDMKVSYQLDSFAQAIDAMDANIRQFGSSYLPIQVLFDVKTVMMSPDGRFKPADDELAGADGGPDLSAPGLPADIQSHIFEGVENPDEELNKLIGMEDVKRQVRQMRSRIEFYGDAKSAGAGGNNMVFLGGPGTGKTITARIITRILYDFGYINANRLIEVDGDYLKSGYVGQTGERVNAIVRAAKGGVLFIDEAYLLYDEKANSSVGKEAIGVLLKAMEDDRDDLVVILAGYEDGMNRLLASNEGFASRIKHKIYFKDYTASELVEIFEVFMKDGNSNVKSISGSAKAKLEAYFDFESKMAGFGNARTARNALDKLLDIHADRFIAGHERDEMKFTITEGDMDKFIEIERERAAADGRNFMATSHLDESIISSADLRSRTRKGAADPDAALEFLVGMDDVKEEIRAFKRRSDFYRDNPELADAQLNLHTVLVGPAGSGKTTIAGIMCGYLYQAGYIRENSYVDVTGDFLRGSYVGHTGKRTEAIIEYSKGMVLFIDEAYLLNSSAGSNDFGAEALGVLINAMEKSRGELVVILAGYEDEMNTLLEQNPGMRSRIGTTLHLRGYDIKTLLQIFQRVAYQRGFKADQSLWNPMAQFVKPYMGTPSFGNARFMRQLVEDCISAHIDRFTREPEGTVAKDVLDVNDLSVVIEKRNR